MPFEVEEFVFEELIDEENPKEENEERDGVKKSSDGSDAKKNSQNSSESGEKRVEDSFVIDKEAIKRELQEIIETTKKQALEEARLIKEQAKKEGFELGYREGYEKGLKDAKGVFDKIIEEYTLKMQQAIEKLAMTASEISKKYEELESVATDMVLDIAKKVISNELKTNREAVRSMVKDALGLVDSKKIKIRMNPEDVSKLDKSVISESKTVEIVEDKNLKKGSLIIEEDNGNIIDASVDTKLEQIKGTLVNE